MTQILRQYYWGDRKSIQIAIAQDMEAFKKRYGYTPKIVRVRADEIAGIIDIPNGWEIASTLQPRHFQLGPLVFRKPRKLMCERTPVR